MKKHIVINRWWLAGTLLIGFLLLYTLGCLFGIDTGAPYVFLLISVLLAALLVGYCAYLPLYIAINDTGICIVYLFGRRETAAWENIRAIRLHYYRSRKGGVWVYVFNDLTANRRRVRGTFPRSRRVTRLLRQYWPGYIAGEEAPKLHGHVPNSVQTDKVERQARDRLRHLLHDYRAAFAAHGITLSSRCWYAYRESSSGYTLTDPTPLQTDDRPPEHYRLACEITLCDTDGMRYCYLSDTLVTVRCTKECFQPFPDKGSTDRLHQALRLALTTIKSNSTSHLFTAPPVPFSLTKQYQTYGGNL
ncbi:MAG: hypothetical protein IJZ13_09425 [Clostridia bacterium]|nr:hypothetical protein [Clostridia bacterium]